MILLVVVNILACIIDEVSYSGNYETELLLLLTGGVRGKLKWKTGLMVMIIQ